MKRGAPNHPKTHHLAELLKVKHVTVIGHLELLFHFTSQYAPKGDIGRYSDKRIAAAVEWSGSPERLIEALVTSGWVERDDTTRLFVHDWHEHADRSTLQRLSRAGEKPVQRNVEVTEEVCTQSELKIRTPPRGKGSGSGSGSSGESAERGKTDLTPDRSWEAFCEAAAEVGLGGCSSTEWEHTRDEHWARLSLEDRIRATQGLRARAGTDDPALKSLPYNYLKWRKWERPIQKPMESPAERKKRQLIAEVEQDMRERGLM